jgi:hypothetical protein
MPEEQVTTELPSLVPDDAPKKPKPGWRECLLASAVAWAVTAGPFLFLPQMRWQGTLAAIASAGWLLFCTWGVFRGYRKRLRDRPD